MRIMKNKPKLPFIERVVNGITKYYCYLGFRTIIVEEIDVGILSSEGAYLQDINGKTNFYQYFLDLDNNNVQFIEDLTDSNILRVVNDPNYTTMLAIQVPMITNCSGYIDSITSLDGFPTTTFEFDFYTHDKSHLKGIIIVNQIDNNMPYGKLTNEVISRVESNIVDIFLKRKLTVYGSDNLIKDFGIVPSNLTDVVDRIVAIEAVNTQQDNKDIEQDIKDVEQDSRIDILEQSSGGGSDLATLQATALSF